MKQFYEAASHYRYFNAFSLALETGMRIGEIIGLKWSDIDFANRTIYVNRTLVYIKSDDANSPNYNKWGFEFHEPKDIADYLRTFYNPADNESLLPYNRRYAHIRNDKFENGANENHEGVIPIKGVKVV